MHRMVTSASGASPPLLRPSETPPSFASSLPRAPWSTTADEDDVDDGGEAGRDALLVEAAGGRIGDSNDDMEMYVYHGVAPCPGARKR